MNNYEQQAQKQDVTAAPKRVKAKTAEERILRRRETKANYEKRNREAAKERRDKHRAQFDKISISLHKDFRDALEELCQQTGLSKTQLFLFAVEELHHIKLKH